MSTKQSTVFVDAETVLHNRGDGGAGGAKVSARQCTTRRATRQIMWSGDRHVASCDGDGVLRKTALASKHMLRAPSGWCFDAAIIATAEARGVQRVEVRDSETGDLYTAALSDFRAHGIELDRGHGPQVCLPLTRWRVTRRGAPRQLTLL